MDGKFRVLTGMRDGAERACREVADTLHVPWNSITTGKHALGAEAYRSDRRVSCSDGVVLIIASVPQRHVQQIREMCDLARKPVLILDAHDMTVSYMVTLVDAFVRANHVRVLYVSGDVSESVYEATRACMQSFLQDVAPIVLSEYIEPCE